MTRLEAINELMEAIAASHASAVASSGTWPSLTYQETDAGDAERILDREAKKILSEGFYLNTLNDFVIYRPTYYYSYSNPDPTFTFGETITDGDGITSQFNYVDTVNDRVYVGNLSGTPDASPGTLTGSTSGNTKSATSSTAVSSSKIAADPYWISMTGSDSESKSLAMIYDSTLGVHFLQDMNPDSDANPTTTTFTLDSVKVNAIKNIEFTTMPHSLQQWVVAQAAVAFQRYKKGATVDDSWLQGRLLKARGNFLRENTDQARTNILNTSWMQDFKGGRRGAGYGRW